MQKILMALDGLKTYILCGFLVVLCVLKKWVEIPAEFFTLVTAMAIMALRAGVAKSAKLARYTSANRGYPGKGSLNWILVTCCLMLVIAGCESKTVSGPGGWTAKFDRLLCEYQFDRAVIVVEPNGVATITFEKYKSDGTEAINLARDVLKIGGGAAAGVVVP